MAVDSIINQIKSISNKVAEDYVLLNKNMNNNLIDIYSNGEIENTEVLKRICELANQNVYLTKFNTPGTDKSNITFDLADYDSIYTQIKQSENSMKDYNTPPDSFKTLIESVVGSMPEIKADDGAVEKTAELRRLVGARDSMRAFVGGLETIRQSEINNAEESFNKLAHDAKLITARNESIGDMAKIACMSVKNMGLDPTRVAMAYDLAHKELTSNGYTVKTEFTKLSSYKVNDDSEAVKPARELALSIEKIAAVNEMIKSASIIINNMSDLIKKGS